MRTQAAIQAATISADQLFGEWMLLKEFEKPLCKLTLSNAAAAGTETYKLTVKPGCDASIAGIGLTTWRLDRDELVLAGPGGAWRFYESDTTTWERISAQHRSAAADAAVICSRPRTSTKVRINFGANATLL